MYFYECLLFTKYFPSSFVYFYTYISSKENVKIVKSNFYSECKIISILCFLFIIVMLQERFTHLYYMIFAIQISVVFISA